MNTTRIINPATGETSGEFEPLSIADARAALMDLQQAHLEWSGSTTEDRHLVLTRLAQSLEDESDALAREMAVHLGKPIQLGRREVFQAAAACRWHAEQAEALLANRHIGEQPRRYTTPRPLGVTLGMVPEHSPVLETSVFVAANLLAGNGILLATSGPTLSVARQLAQLLGQCGVPGDLTKLLPIEADTVAELAAQREIQLCWFSGDAEIGSNIARQAATHMTRSVLQLDGNDAAIIAADADLERAARLCAQSCLDNAGQYPWSLQRMIVHQSVLPAFQDLLVSEFQRWQPGDPLEEDTRLGPLVSRANRDAIHEQVQICAAQDAETLVGGATPEAFPENSAYYPPTLVAKVAHGHPLYHLPIRGPVAALIPVLDLDGALKIANDSAYGMGVSLFTRDIEQAEHLGRERIASATIAVNSLPGPRIDLPIGGLRRGGLGRLHGAAGFEHFINLKSIVIDDSEGDATEQNPIDSSDLQNEADPPKTDKTDHDRSEETQDQPA